MRPGQLTPENDALQSNYGLASDGFNEAGAINPGKRAWHPDGSYTIASFNEAGAINPGKLGDEALASGGRLSFNEAGAINPGKQAADAREDVRECASMRPGQLTPENAPGASGSRKRETMLQ